MSEQSVIGPEPSPEPIDKEQQSRRDFLIGLGRWSKIVIGAAVLGGISAGAPNAEAAAWVNRRGGGGAVVAHPAGGGAWVNHRGGGGAWVNRR
jgi:hypothetical protein